MKSFRFAVAALALSLAPGAIAQNTVAPAAAPVAAAPGPSAQTTGTPATIAKADAFPMAAPEANMGQPLPAGYEIQPQVTPNGKKALWMHNVVLMPIITAISVFVLGLLFWVAFRYRRSASPVPSKTSHNTVIEVVWTLVPVLILVAIAIPSISLLAAQYKPPPKNAVTIKAIGNQWYWTYEYPDHGGFEIVANMLKEKGQPINAGERLRTDADGPRLLAVDNRIVVPVGVPVRLLTTSNDVIHSWAVPAFWTKMDAVPGRTNETSFTVDRPGVYYGQCSELCGARHAFMPIAVEAVSPANFARWIASKGGTMPGGGVGPTGAALSNTMGGALGPSSANPPPAKPETSTDAPTPGTTTATAPSQASQTNSGTK